MLEKFQAIGVDLGGTKVAIGLVDSQGNVSQQKRVPTNVDGGPDAIQKQILTLINEIRQIADHSIVGVGIGVPGQVEEESGLVRFAPNLNWDHVPLKANLIQALELPLTILNDVRAATWGEWLFGAGENIQDLVCVFVGTGIGGGIVSGGRMLNGCTNTAGEIGHMVVDIHGPHCTCGNRGCFEALAGGWAIAKRAQDAVRNYGESARCILNMAGGKVEQINAKTVIECAQSRDPLSELILEQIKQAIIAGCVSLVNAFNPCRLILGGGIMEGAAGIIPDIEKGIKEKSLAAAARGLEVVPARLIHDAGVVGSAAFAMHQFSK